MSQEKKSGEKVTIESKEKTRTKAPGGIAPREEQKKIQITKIRDSEAGGLPSVKNEDFFHGFMPREQVGSRFRLASKHEGYSSSTACHTDRLLLRVGDFLVRQAVRAENKSAVAKGGGVVLTNKTDEEIEVRLLTSELVQSILLGLIEYHKRHKIPIDEENTIIKRAIKKADWQLNHEQIIKTKRLGSGAFGDVYKGILRSGLIDKKEVAIKTINGSISAEENEKLFQEAMLMKTLVHPNVILLIGVASNEEPVMIVMELAPGGAVLDAVQAKPGPSTYIRIKYCLDAAQGLTYLSGKGIIHRDIAARNTLIGKNNTAKISDFGLSCLGAQKKEKTLKKVPVRYLAPETLQTRSYTTKTDVWTFGIYMWEVFHDGMTPYDEFPNTAAIRKFVLAGNRLNNESDRYPEYLWTLTQVLTHLL
ncbi:protein tyrosine kinase [Ancylostoma duodenale]|uniref:Protein tyrosine kinase n=1 Tax=Ancylostoma duodenale TaxID=51022 RepID=A0A0C2D084_9BILA|nr:protein tyrosine kinase [Ancylostoma duodenale]